METTESIHRDAWMKDVDSRLSGVSYPMDRSVAEQKLKGLNIDGDDATKNFGTMVWPAKSHDDFVDKLKKSKTGGAAPEHGQASSAGTDTS